MRILRIAMLVIMIICIVFLVFVFLLIVLEAYNVINIGSDVIRMWHRYALVALLVGVATKFVPFNRKIG